MVLVVQVVLKPRLRQAAGIVEPGFRVGFDFHRNPSWVWVCCEWRVVRTVFKEKHNSPRRIGSRRAHFFCDDSMKMVELQKKPPWRIHRGFFESRSRRIEGAGKKKNLCLPDS